MEGALQHIAKLHTWVTLIILTPVSFHIFHKPSRVCNLSTKGDGHLFFVAANSGELWAEELPDLFSCDKWLESGVFCVLGETSRLMQRGENQAVKTSKLV